MEEWLNKLLVKILNKDQELLDFMKQKYGNPLPTDVFGIYTKKHGYFGIEGCTKQRILELVNTKDESFLPFEMWIEHRLPIGLPTYITGVDINGKPLQRVKPWGDKEEKLAGILVHVLKSAGLKI